MPDPTPENPQLQAHLDAVQRLRAAGYGWDNIHEYYAQQTSRLRAAGYSEDKIAAYYGGTDPAPVVQDMQERQVQNQRANQPTSLLDAFANGLTNSSGAALLGIAKKQEATQGFFPRLASGAGEAIGDVPVGTLGAALGAPAGGAAGAAVPVLGETGVGEVGGALVGGGAGAFALPQLVKSERDAWAQAHAAGWSLDKFIGAQVDVAKQTLEQGGIGALTAGFGGIATKALERAGVSGALNTAGKIATEAGTMTAAESAVKGQAFTTEDLVDGAVLIGAFHAGARLSGATMQGIRGRLVQHYQETGENPLAAAQRARNDPVLRSQMLGVPNPPARPGSSRTPVEPGFEADQYVVPRVAGDFDTAVDFTLKHEGSPTVVDANGALVKWGINQADHPEVDVRTLSREGAAEIYKHKYWDAIGADELPPNMRLAAFDTAVVEGVARAREWLKESGGDVQQFLARRAAFEAKLARDNPAKYARFSRTWAARIRDLGGDGQGVEILGKDPNEPVSENQQAFLDSEGKPPEKPPGGEEPPERPPGEPGDEGALDRVMSRTAPQRESDWWGDTAHSAARIYGEMFNPDHPIRSLMESVTKGEPLDDITRPEALRRIAENSPMLAKYAIEHNAVDLDGNVVGRGLKAIIEDAGNKNAQREFLDGYARSKWAQMMHEKGLKTGIAPEDADAVVERLKGKYAALFEELKGWRNHTLRWLGDGDLHDKTKVDSLIDANDAMMPGYRDMGDGTARPNPSPGKGMWSPIREAKGSERLIEPIEQSLMREAFLRRALAETNRSNVAIADAAMEGNKATQRRAVNINVMMAMDELKKAGLENEDLPTALVKAAGQQVRPDEVPIFRNGKLYGVTFENPEVTNVLRGYDSGVRSSAVQLAASITAIPRTLQTIANPLFAPKMQIYDAWFQHITNPDSRNVAKSFTLGLGALLDKNSPRYDEWMRSGGAERVFTRMSNDDYLKHTFGLREPDATGLMDNGWNVARTAYHMMDAWARAASTPIRLGRYIQGREAGESRERAAAASTESSLHRPAFGGPLSRTLNSVIPFLTARLNGMEKTARAMMGGSLEVLSGGRLSNKTSTGIPYSAKQFWINGAVAITVPALMSWWFNKDQEWYKAAPDWQKDNAIAWIPPMFGMAAIPIPAPPLLGPIFSGMPRRLMEAFFEDDPHAFDNLGPSLFAGLAGPTEFVSASVIQPIIEHMANYSFLKNQPLINPDTKRGVGTAEQFNHYSSGAAKAVAAIVNDLPLVNKLGLSPVVIDNYIRYWGGIPVEVLQKAFDAVGANFSDNKPPESKFSDWPGVASWQARYPTASAQPITTYYDQIDGLEDIHGSINKLVQDGHVAAAIAKINANPLAASLHELRFKNMPEDFDPSPIEDAVERAQDSVDPQALSLIKEGVQAMRQASQYANKVWESPGLSAHDKRQDLDQTYAEMQVMAERLNAVIDRGAKGHAARNAPATPQDIEFTPPDERVQ